ncbi:Adenylate kinase, active site lid [Musa troglodytarum]|uniref:adenylate kinase n=1 Tax=Musa troglodytarum TaxID=320322 RepID=A0A9E7HZY1_9LILI|nr:Adenylate kinase, active site lid [Musa troglodytarum]
MPKNFPDSTFPLCFITFVFIGGCSDHETRGAIEGYDIGSSCIWEGNPMRTDQEESRYRLCMQYQLVHIAAGDLLRAEIAAGTERGKRAKEYMEKGMLVPDEIVVMMVKERLLQPDAQENGWLLDGYPRSFSQAKALEDLGIRPDIFILLDASIPPY